MPSRRRFLAASTVAGAAALAGCSALPFGGGGDGGNDEPSPEPSDDTPRETHVESGWPNPRRDPAHTGWVPDGGVADPSVEWRSDPVAFNARPTVSGATVVVGDDGLTGIDVLSGDTLWSSRYGDDAWAAPVVDDVAYATTRTLDGDDQSGVVALDAVDGEVLNATAISDPAGIPPTRSFDDVRDRYFLPVEGGVRAVVWPGPDEDSTGDDEPPEWRQDVFGTHAAPLAYESGLIVAATGSGEVYTFGMNGDGNWRYNLNDMVTVPPVVGAQRVYVGTHEQLVALERIDGGEAWRVSRPATAPLALDDGRLYTVHGDALVARSPRTGGAVWETSLDNRPSTAPAVGGDAVYLGREDGEVHAFDVEDGEQRWTRSVGDALGPTLALTSDRLYAVAESDGTYRVVSVA
jgi:outer membrane protein assembly factor BamB